VFAVLIVVFLGLGFFEPVFEPPYLILILNTVFLTFSSLVVASLSARSYLSGSKSNIILLGCAFLVNGVAQRLRAGFFRSQQTIL
jgi:hypothetical protein